MYDKTAIGNRIKQSRKAMKMTQIGKIHKEFRHIETGKAVRQAE